jgi:uncharacterized protein (TIGR00255 family)
MIKSMTGYGSFRTEQSEIFAEIKSVNHKFFECSVHAGRAYGFLEDRIRKYVSESISRGKVDINITIASTASDETLVTANKPVLDGYLSALNDFALNADYSISPTVNFEMLLKIPDGFTVQKAQVDEEQLWSDIKNVLSKALESFSDMRQNEGCKLCDDIRERLSAIAENVETIDRLSPNSAEKYRLKLTERLNELLSGNADEQRILTEAAIIAEKTAVFEETVRLKSHLSQFESFLSANEPIGRKMDFLTQEMNREANTIGSKAQDLEITKLVLNIKSDIEKIREQVQNIE